MWCIKVYKPATVNAEVGILFWDQFICNSMFLNDTGTSENQPMIMTVPYMPQQAKRRNFEKHFTFLFKQVCWQQLTLALFLLLTRRLLSASSPSSAGDKPLFLLSSAASPSFFSFGISVVTFPVWCDMAEYAEAHTNGVILWNAGADGFLFSSGL